MTDSYLGEIQAFAFGYYPNNWLPCDGRPMAIRQNAALYSLIGTSYGGDGTTTFLMPNLVGRVAMNQGSGPGLPSHSVGDAPGEMTVTLGLNEMPSHSHGLQLGNKTSPNGTPGPSATSNVAIDPGFNGFMPPPVLTTLAKNAVTMAGNSQPHPNAQPTLAMIYCICVNGIFPSFGDA
ncbi:tail fiber protein [Tardiphaga sp.]|uniref:phage tail protein n=1 Tax=Tardiphaga sp. TaxID=1926292 RepID=UPI002608B1CD|nr:tail fiber protein [Tardiphaga sp.]MDB5616351.1 hypothetical protein [Tardiphaga sp.]